MNIRWNFGLCFKGYFIHKTCFAQLWFLDSHPYLLRSWRVCLSGSCKCLAVESLNSISLSDPSLDCTSMSELNKVKFCTIPFVVQKINYLDVFHLLEAGVMKFLSSAPSLADIGAHAQFLVFCSQGLPDVKKPGETCVKSYEELIDLRWEVCNIRRCGEIPINRWRGLWWFNMCAIFVRVHTMRRNSI